MGKFVFVHYDPQYRNVLVIFHSLPDTHTRRHTKIKWTKTKFLKKKKNYVGYKKLKMEIISGKVYIGKKKPRLRLIKFME